MSCLRSALSFLRIGLLVVGSLSTLAACGTPPGKRPTDELDTGALPADTAVDPVSVGLAAAADTAAPEVCGECSAWAAARGETFEVSADTDPNDCDGDGASNADELAQTWPADDGSSAFTHPCAADTDHDGLLDTEEGGCTNPTVTDTDHDGVGDGDEVAAGTDPCVGDQ